MEDGTYEEDGKVFWAHDYGVVADLVGDGSVTPGTDQTAAINTWLAAISASKGLGRIRPDKTGLHYRVDGVIAVPGSTTGGIKVHAWGAYFRRIAAAATPGYTGNGTDPMIQFRGNQSEWWGGIFQTDKASPIGAAHFGPFDPSWITTETGAFSASRNTFRPEMLSGPTTGYIAGSVGVRFSATYTPFGFGSYFNTIADCIMARFDIPTEVTNQANGSMMKNLNYRNCGRVIHDFSGGASGPTVYMAVIGGSVQSSHGTLLFRFGDKGGYVGDPAIVPGASEATSSVAYGFVDGFVGEPAPLNFSTATADPGVSTNNVTVPAHGLQSVHIGRLCRLVGGDWDGRDLDSKITALPDADTVTISGTIRTAVTVTGNATFRVESKIAEFDLTTQLNRVDTGVITGDSATDLPGQNAWRNAGTSGSRETILQAKGLVLPWGTENRNDSIFGDFMSNELTNYDLRGGTVTETLGGTVTATGGVKENVVRPGDATTSRALDSGNDGGTAVYEIAGVSLGTYGTSRWWPFLMLRSGHASVTSILVEYKANDDLWYTVLNDTSPSFSGGLWADPLAAFDAPFGGASGTAVCKGLRFTLNIQSHGIVHISELGASARGAPFGLHTIPRVEKANTFRANQTIAAGFSLLLGTTLDLSGAGSPEGVITAPVGSIYRRTDGGVSTTIYVKESGAGNTGWVAYGPSGRLWTLKTSAQALATESTTLVDVTEMGLTMVANAFYRLSGYVAYDADGATDMRLSFTVPTSAVLLHTQDGPISTIGVGVQSGSRHFEAIAKDTVIIHGGSNVGAKNGVTIVGSVRTGATAGPIQLQAAQGTSSLTVATIAADSWLELVRVA